MRFVILIEIVLLHQISLTNLLNSLDWKRDIHESLVLELPITLYDAIQLS